MSKPTDYPALWQSGEIQRQMYVRAGWRCEHCNMPFLPGTTRAEYATNKDGKPSLYTVHHLDGDKLNCDWTNLLACCQACHLHIQGRWKPGGYLPAEWNGVAPQWLLDRHLPFQIANQLALF